MNSELLFFLLKVAFFKLSSLLNALLILNSHKSLKDKQHREIQKLEALFFKTDAY